MAADKLASAVSNKPFPISMESHKKPDANTWHRVFKKVASLKSVQPSAVRRLLSRRGCQAPLDERGTTGWLSLEMVTSTRRFCARPEGVSLSATGYSLP